MHGSAILFVRNVAINHFVDVYLTETCYNAMARHHEDHTRRADFIKAHGISPNECLIEAETFEQMKSLCADPKARLSEQVLHCRVHVDTRNYFLSTGGKWCLEELGIDEVVDVGSMIIKEK